MHFCDHPVKHGLVQARARDDLLELAALLLKLPLPTLFGRPDPAVLLAPDVDFSSLMPIPRHTYSTLIASSARFSANAFAL